MAGRYPDADNLDELWENLAAGRNSVGEIPKERWNYEDYSESANGRATGVNTRWGGFLKDVDKFDPLFFGIAPREAELLDPQERLFLQTAWHVLEDAGYNPEEYGGNGGAAGNVGVFVGVMYGEYQLYGLAETLKGHMLAAGSSYASIANRVSYYFNFTGPSFALDSMCSSSLTAIHLACDSIRSGECESAIAGGVNLSLHPNKYIMLSQNKFTSPEGLCRSFGAGGTGFVPGEGVGAFLLKPLSRAKRDGDHIYGVIRSSSINHGGRTNGYTVPNPRAQGDLIENAIKRAGVTAEDIGYIEAHGTGTALGDPIEIAGLTRAFGKYTGRKQFIPIGSLKSNLGHLEGAAGIVAASKVLLQFEHKKISPSLHSRELNPNIDFSKTPFYVPQSLADWRQGKGPRRAGVSSFGAGGANAHLILEDYEQNEAEIITSELERPLFFVFSSDSKEQLRDYLLSLQKYLSRRKEKFLDRTFAIRIAHTLQTGRKAFKYRLLICVNDLKSLEENIRTWTGGGKKIEPAGFCVAGATSGNPNAAPEKMDPAEFAVLLAGGENEKIARYWVEGGEIPWERMYGESRPRKITLPGYVFLKRRCWVEPETDSRSEGGELQEANEYEKEILELLQAGQINEEEALALLAKVNL